MAAVQCNRLCLFVLVCLQSTAVLALTIVVTPPKNQIVPEMSEDNVTFICNVTGSDSTGMVLDSTIGDAIWEVQRSQIPNVEGNNQIRDNFAAIGVFVNVIESGVTEVIITSQARNEYRQSGNDVDLRCVARLSGIPPTSQFGDMLSVITYGPPSAPTGLSLDPVGPDDLSELIFRWQMPAQQPEGVNITYHPIISGLSINLANSTQFTSVKFRDEISSRDCRPHNFSVSARNLAGVGPVQFIERTIPISPDLAALNEGFKISSVSLSDPIMLSITVPLAFTCSLAFPILNYSLVTPTSSLLAPVLLGDGSILGAEVTSQVMVPGLGQDVELQVNIEVCISITCRNSTMRLLRTSDIQDATITFFENNVQLRCSFAVGSTATGCKFLLSVGGNVTEMFLLLQGDSAEITQCQQTMNQGNIFDSITVYDVEASGEAGTLILNLTPVFIEDITSYTTITSCTIPQSPSALTTGGVVGVVLAALLLVLGALLVLTLLIVYRVRTGQWFKIKVDDDDELLTVHFEKKLLMGDLKPPKTKSKDGMSSGDGHSSPDVELRGVTALSQPTSSPPTSSPLNSHTRKSDLDMALTAVAEVEEVDGGVVGDGEGEVVSSATAPLLSALPGHAFTLDISADHKKVKLHLNRALIKRTLLDRNLKTMERKKPSLQRQVSIFKLPLSCEIRVKVPEEDGPPITI